ncbi:835_t:CDS:2, partial [Racocetra fulgida]
KKGIQRGLQIARRGFQLYSDMEFDSVERERKRLKADEHNYEKPQSQSIDDSEMLPVKADLVSASSKPLKILSTGSFADLRQEGGYYLDKTHFITKIEYLNARAILSLRPRPSSFLVLKFNFSGLRTNSTFEVFKEDFHKSLNVDMTKFMCRYRQELKDYYQVLDKKESALVNFKELLNAVELSEHKLYVFIDEYDAGMTKALNNEYTLQLLIAHHKNSPSRTEVIESSFKQFYSRLKSACNDGLVYVFQTGVTPIVMAEFTS